MINSCFRPHLRWTVVLGWLVCFLPNAAQATEGSFVHAQGAIGRSLTGAGVAYPTDAASMMVNPAGIVDLDRRLDLGLNIVLSDVILKPEGLIGNPLVDRMTNHRFFFIPSAGVILPTPDGAVGIGLYVPSGIGVDFPQPRNVLTRLLLSNADRRLDYQQYRLALTYGHDLGNGWSVGAGLYANLSRFRSDTLTLSLRTASGNHKWDEAPGIGFALGVYKKWDRWSVGATYTSPQWSEPFDRYKDVSSHGVTMPQQFQIGVAYRAKPSLTLMADYRYINWGNVKPLGQEPLEGGFGWRDQHIVKLGVEWQIDDKWTMRSGISHGNAPIAEEHVFINGLTAASTITTHFGFGLSRRLTENATVHATILRAFNNAETASANGDLFSLLSAGTEIGLGHDEVTVGFTYKF